MSPCGALEILLCVRSPEGMMEEAGNLSTTDAYCMAWMHQVIYSHSLLKEEKKKAKWSSYRFLRLKHIIENTRLK